MDKFELEVLKRRQESVNSAVSEAESCISNAEFFKSCANEISSALAITIAFENGGYAYLHFKDKIDGQWRSLIQRSEVNEWLKEIRAMLAKRMRERADEYDEKLKNMEPLKK